jgi:hypothetical protein
LQGAHERLRDGAGLLHTRLQQWNVRRDAMHVGQPSVHELGSMLQRKLRRLRFVHADHHHLPNVGQRVHQSFGMLLEGLPQRILFGRWLVLLADQRRLRQRRRLLWRHLHQGAG